MNLIKGNPVITVKNYGPKGRGLCALEQIQEGTIIETLPVCVIQTDAYRHVKSLPFINHTFVWNKHPDGETGAIGFGLASLCNHKDEPNAMIMKDFSSEVIQLVALKSINSDEEITIRYNNVPFKVY